VHLCNFFGLKGALRNDEERSDDFFGYAPPEMRSSADHSLREICGVADSVQLSLFMASE
jgi:hypothetical protein